ncbi:MAG: hypothetical protein P8130_10555 [Deltaproteobacteria bacterium]
MTAQRHSAEKTCPGGPRLLALFQKRFDGDDALLELARLRFKQAGMGMEIYSGNIEDVAQLLGFSPRPEATVLVHLPRELNLLSSGDRGLIQELAKNFGSRLYGFVIHDRPEYASRPEDYRSALVETNAALLDIAGRPMLFVEYAAGLDLEQFYSLIASGKDLEMVSACLDIGHLGIRQARNIFAESHPGEDICALTPTDPKLPELMDDMQTAVASVPEAVAGMVKRLAALGKPLHFHLHDGHPLSTVSPFGVSDHLSFFETLPLPFAYKGEYSLPPMFGPAGLRRIVAEACTALSPTALSFTLEIHPASRSEKLDDAASLFNHWTDKTNAERMNGWLQTLTDNHRLLTEICRTVCSGSPE